MTIRPIRLLALLGAILLGLAACGGSSGATAPTLASLSDNSADGPAATTTTNVVADPEMAFQEYAACMRQHGIDMPDPETSGSGGVISIGGEGFDLEAMDEAAAACDPILEGAFGEFELSPEQEAEVRDQELAFARCMRDNGVDWPDPTGDFGSGSIAIDIGDADPETMNAAMDTCSAEVFGDSGGFLVGGESSVGGGSTP